MTDASRIIVLSDLHLPPASGLGNFAAGEKLAGFTRHVGEHAATGHVLVLAGDVVDFLLQEQHPGVL